MRKRGFFYFTACALRKAQLRCFVINRHPGGIIRRRYLEPLKLTMTDLAEAMGVSLSSVSRVVNEKAELTSEMALRLSYVVGGTPEMWMGLQTTYSLNKAKAEFSDEGLRRLNPALLEGDHR